MTVTDQPYPYADSNETWQEFADAQLDHCGTIEQHRIRDSRRAGEALAALREKLAER